ncbi:TonB-dependent receptor plug domain-containing protein [Xanthocytophaga flava]|nr:TonB-dependent receptor [Xanthocytophaga flavus]MDJ1471740.1 TonB-dependent receptor [Xanthocytophaga flavus]
MKRPRLCLLFFGSLLSVYTSWAQSQKATEGKKVSKMDSIQQLQEVVVTATRSERQLGALPMPVIVVSGKQIQKMGSLRLNDVLQEQTGLMPVTNHGNGIQIQGFDPDYTLILVDGEPLIGRTSGTLELSRVTVGNIKQIEIVKGPASSLYGSEALAGVINIITEKPEGLKGSLKGRYGTNETIDITGDFSYKYRKLGVYAFVNRYHTGGYDFTPAEYGNTVDPFTNYTYNTKLTYDFSSRVKLSLSGRYFTESQTSASVVSLEGASDTISGTGKVTDWNINPTLIVKFAPQFKTNFRLYASRYHTSSLLSYEKDNSVYDETFFTQTFLRPEVIAEFSPVKKHTITFGGGGTSESVYATRYTSKKHFSTVYGLFQYEWLANKDLTLIAGGRFDHHSLYGGQISPKLSGQYEILPWLAFRASLGTGFKAPDFRQVYLNFTNSTVGYSVFGIEEQKAGIDTYEALGQIARYLVDSTLLNQTGRLKAERSVAYNAGFKITPIPRVMGNINFFRNNIQNLINTRPLAEKTNGQYIYGYQNISRAVMQGIETDWTYQLNKHLSVSAGYQLLYAYDQDVLDQIAEGKIYIRDPKTLKTSRMKRNQYGGLLNRSRHSGNIKFFYEDSKTGISGSLRGIYRGKYGLTDTDGNGALNEGDEYVKGYMLWNIAMAKTFRKMMTVQAGIDNLFNFQNTAQITTIPGRIVYASLQFVLAKNQ